MITIKKLFIGLIYVGVILSSILYYNYLIGLDVQKKTKPIVDYVITDFRCSGTYEVSSSVDISYNGGTYKLVTTTNECFKLRNGVLNPKIYYYKEKDVVFIEGHYFSYAYSLVTILIFIILPLIGFYVYRNELDNHYSTM